MSADLYKYRKNIPSKYEEDGIIGYKYNVRKECGFAKLVFDEPALESVMPATHLKYVMNAYDRTSYISLETTYNFLRKHSLWSFLITYFKGLFRSNEMDLLIPVSIYTDCYRRCSKLPRHMSNEVAGRSEQRYKCKHQASFRSDDVLANVYSMGLS